MVSSDSAENQLSWTGPEGQDASAVSWDLTGSTNWKKVLDGNNDVKVQYEIEMVLERYPTDDSSLSDNTGILWAMPRADSTPAENKWEVGAFMQGSAEASSEKT